MKDTILIPATVARISSRKDKSLLLYFDTGEVPAQTAGALYAMQNAAVYLAVKETAFNAQEGGNPGSLIALANILPEITAEAKKRY